MDDALVIQMPHEWYESHPIVGDQDRFTDMSDDWQERICQLLRSRAQIKFLSYAITQAIGTQMRHEFVQSFTISMCRQRGFYR